ncbi:hypothetical protein AJ80_08681 [Polytolypa hystricis UAMH7299]|uniref:Phytocyanin domain-containing protein n=1 Tax=Polytolypa hystricis (strain UAMH7299) TaxID=1447883 RepID=A0A2B7X3T3_POLH7|nr:hypothetical protein AJ80_08681 [Polytolypa hystricis UAMH7299]
MRSSYLLKFLLPAAFAQHDNGGDENGTANTTIVTSDGAGTQTQSGDHVIQVGDGGFVFTPDTVTAAVGDKIQFVFHPMNHSVVRSTFDDPCVPTTEGTIFSGFVPVDSGTSPNVFIVTVNDTNPAWLYCSQNRDSHCQNGMVMVINPLTTGPNTLAAYKEAATKTSESISPPEIVGGEFSNTNNSVSPNGASPPLHGTSRATEMTSNV